MSSRGKVLLLAWALVAIGGFWRNATAQGQIVNHQIALTTSAGPPVRLEAAIPADSLASGIAYLKLALRAIVEDLPVGEGIMLSCSAFYRSRGEDSVLYSISDYFERERGEAGVAVGFDLSGLLAFIPEGCAEDQLVLELSSPTSNLQIDTSEGGGNAVLQILAGD